MRRKFEMDNEVGSVARMKNKIKARNVEDWGEEVAIYEKHIEMVKFEKDGTGVERYMRSYSVRRVRGSVQAEDRLSCIFGG